MKKIILVFIAFFSLFLFPLNIFAELNLITTPLKYELNLEKGETVTKTAKLINNSNDALNIKTGKTNLIVEQNTGKPIFIENTGNPNIEMSDWITIYTDSFTVTPMGDYIIDFSITVPTTATPGGHYGAVYFEYNPKSNNVSVTSTGGNININAKYGILLLINVEGDIEEGGEPKPPIIGGGPGESGEGSSSGGNKIGAGGINWEVWQNKSDDCPFGDFSSSNRDGKCFDEITLENLLNYVKGQQDDSLSSYATNIESQDNSDSNEDFGVSFALPFENTGNTHIKPSGQITLIDEDGNILKGIGTEKILDENGLIVGEKITDYLPINDEGGNVFPNTQRIFNQKWAGFPYETYDETGKIIIKYWTPSQYYSNKDKNKTYMLYPWQKLYTRYEYKKITAETDINYTSYTGEIVEFNSAQDFYIQYEVENIGLNLYFFITLGIILLGTIFILWFIFFLLKKATKKKCISCGKYIKKDLNICPYCGTKQKKVVRPKRKK